MCGFKSRRAGYNTNTELVKQVQQVQLHVVKVRWLFNLAMSAFFPSLCYKCSLTSSGWQPKTPQKSAAVYENPDWLEVAEDADVGELLAVSVRVQGQKKRPFESQEAPHTGEVEAPRVSGSCGAEKSRVMNTCSRKSIIWVKKRIWAFNNARLSLILYYTDNELWTWRERITLLLCDGESQEGDEGDDGQHWEEHADGDEELEAFEPGAPVILQVHDVRDKSPERQHSCQRQTHTHTHSSSVFLKHHRGFIQITGASYPRHNFLTPEEISSNSLFHMNNSTKPQSI